MAQASSSWRQLLNQIQVGSRRRGGSSLLQSKTGGSKKQLAKRFRGPGGYLGFLTLVVAMFLWDWKLLLSSGVGTCAMILMYSMYKWDWQQRWSQVSQKLNTPNSRLATSVVGGAVAMLSTYMAAAIWAESDSHWIAAGTIVQGTATVLTLVLLIWQITSLYGSREEDQIDDFLVNLTASDSLTRLIAIRQLTKLVRRRGNSPETETVIQCLRLLLTKEEEAVVRSAAFESLQVLDREQPLSSPAIGVPLAPLSIREKQVEEL